jgi:transcriptional regulator with XRE-family HTH domain
MTTDWRKRPRTRVVKDDVRALRQALKLSQDAVAERSGGRLKRVEVSRIETGGNRATSDRVRVGLASAFGLSRDEMADYLEGRADLVLTLDRIRRRKLGGEGDASKPMTPLDIAIAFFGDTISPAAAARVREAAAGHEHEKKPIEWGQDLRKAQQTLLESTDAVPLEAPAAGRNIGRARRTTKAGGE